MQRWRSRAFERWHGHVWGVYHRSLLSNGASVTTHQRESWKDLGPAGVNLDAVDRPLNPLPDLHEGVVLVLELRCRRLTHNENAEMFGVDCTAVVGSVTVNMHQDVATKYFGQGCSVVPYCGFALDTAPHVHISRGGVSVRRPEPKHKLTDGPYASIPFPRRYLITSSAE